MDKIIQILKAEEQKLKSKIYSKEKEIARLKIDLEKIQEEISSKNK
jgi:predicted  nucleic acid-binding Zn-ribbon protein